MTMVILVNIFIITAQSCGNLPNVEILVVDNHEEEAKEEGAGNGNVNFVPVPPDDRCSDLLPQGPQCHQQDVLH